MAKVGEPGSMAVGAGAPGSPTLDVWVTEAEWLEIADAIEHDDPHPLLDQNGGRTRIRVMP